MWSQTDEGSGLAGEGLFQFYQVLVFRPQTNHSVTPASASSFMQQGQHRHLTALGQELNSATYRKSPGRATGPNGCPVSSLPLPFDLLHSYLRPKTFYF